MSTPLIMRVHTERMNAETQIRSILETAATEKRELTAEENGTIAKLHDVSVEANKRMTELLDNESRADAIDEQLRNHKPSNTPGTDAEQTLLRSFLVGDVTQMVLRTEGRDLSKGTASAGGNTIQTSFYQELVAHLIEVAAVMQAGCTVLRTTSGETIQIPTTTAHSTAAIVTEAGTIGASDPTFGQKSLSAYKYGILVKVSRELAADTSVDLLGYLAMECGRAVGNAFGAHAITGTGTSQPRGILQDTTAGVTGAASVGGAFTADNLIDLFYSVIAPYRNSKSCGWIVKDATLATVRKLKDTTNQYLWQPSLVAGAPDMLLGKPIMTDPNVPAVALSAKSVIFGDMSRYFVRMVNDIIFERSTEFAFNTDQVTFRCLVRADGTTADTTGAIKHFIGNAA